MEEEEEDPGLESQNSALSGDENQFLGATLDCDALARSLADTQTTNELGLLSSEVRRLRLKIKTLEREKDDLIDNFRDTTKILLNRLKELEGQLSDSQSRPQTAAVIERIEGRAAKPPLPQPRSGGSSRSSRSSAGRAPHAPEVLRIEEEPPGAAPDALEGGGAGGDVGDDEEGGGEFSTCGNCGRPIPTGNLVSHTVTCTRHNFRCAACNEVLLLRDKESHMQLWTDPARLIAAVSSRDVTQVQLMAEHGVEFNLAVHPQTRDTALHAAARLGDVEFISFFMGYGVDVDPVNESGETPLHLAAEGAELPAVKLLIELGANLNIANGKGESPLMLVCRRGNALAAKYLVEMRADAEACTKIGDTPLQIAQRLGYQETVLALCTAGASLRSGTPSRARSNSPMPRAGLGGGGGGGSAVGYPPIPRGGRRAAPSPGRPVAAGAAGRGAAS